MEISVPQLQRLADEIEEVCNCAADISLKVSTFSGDDERWTVYVANEVLGVDRSCFQFSTLDSAIEYAEKIIKLNGEVGKKERLREALKERSDLDKEIMELI